MGVLVGGYQTAVAWPRVTRTVVTPSLVTPVTVSDAKAHLKIDGPDDDLNIDRHIRAATKKIERDTGLALMAQTIEFTFDRFPPWSVLDLPVSPVQSVSWLKYTDTSAVLQTWASSNYLVSGSRLGLVDASIWPTDLRTFTPFTVRVVAGHTTAETIDDELILLLLMQVAWYSENRQLTAAEERYYSDTVARFRIALVA